jgi:lipoyl(octanoyl) transferase
MVLAMLQLGRVDYPTATALQQRLAELRKQQQIPDTLLLLEHEPLLTLGRNRGREHVLASDDLLAARGIALHPTNRGGDVTYHGPGQLVGYPILDLRTPFAALPGSAPLGARCDSASPETVRPRLGAVDYVRRLEDAIVRTCAELGVPTQQICGRTGVWTVASAGRPEKKLCAIGVHINLNPNLADFDLIVPCGIQDRGVTSLEHEIPPPRPVPTMEELGNAVARNLGWALGRQVMALDSLESLLGTADRDL